MVSKQDIKTWLKNQGKGSRQRLAQRLGISKARVNAYMAKNGAIPAAKREIIDRIIKGIDGVNFAAPPEVQKQVLEVAARLAALQNEMNALVGAFKTLCEKMTPKSMENRR